MYPGVLSIHPSPMSTAPRHAPDPLAVGLGPGFERGC
ncbi:hypothetical protein SAMN05421783_103259 [Thiocapsa roseopersicina]|uniref:Uncharacterized protein n=1 Tax=Thiocapsa roseopersicina TaxID=1058 RepID=A0A1H2T2A4_THIRO|nr:hypothetical protein SAMN05421783_103259 [Thiocapsa roseopersicina]